ncbi:hypothetical protein IWQ60_001983 [Tieghemiomyces parasiticus]|uniref:CBS domain-containing protein n=1 Tax=Tieghemiomyces parasiticus TaxID=78921 RepID=A0A9W8AIA8_9FUNG|nr:hypothetical protein IWQ60_001983 [Tieghemiomyces parasiticus]
MMSSSPRSNIPRRAVSTSSGTTTDAATAVASPSANPGDSARRRQTRRDEAIRKKAETELSRKISSPKSRNLQRTKRIPGTVSSLQPSPALTVRHSMTIQEAAQLMAAKRADSVLVVNHDERLAGIFTAKDVAFRVVAEGSDARAVLVSQIMTRDPLCVMTDTSATEALNTMVSRGFRHLPVCNEEGDVVGLLDVIKCMYEALDKMERAYGSSRKLYDALEGVEKEWTVNSGPLMQFVDAMRERMACPDLTTVLRETEPVIVSPRTSVREVAHHMRNQRTTAALVVEDSGRLTGIFTSKDIVLRVIAAGLEPSNCSVVRVMTPHPDTALPTTTVLDALKRMYENHYLNLPVVGTEGDILGLVDVLTLCYSTLEQMKSIQGQEAPEGGPLWSRFFGAAGAGVHDGENDSVYSDSMANSANPHPPPYPGGSAVGSSAGRYRHHPMSPGTDLASAEVYPHESVSVAEDIASAVNSRIGGESYVASTAAGGAGIPVPSAVYDEGLYVFKFKSPTGKVHRFTANYQNLGELYATVVTKLAHDGVEDPERRLHEAGLGYLDEEDDLVLISVEADLLEAVKIARAHQWQRIVLALNPESPATSAMAAGAAVATTPADSRAPSVMSQSVAAGSGGFGVGITPVEIGSLPALSRAASEAAGSLTPTDHGYEYRRGVGKRESGDPPLIPEPWIIPAAIAGGFMAALVGLVIVLKITK